MEDAPETVLTEEQERAVEIEKYRSAFLSGANWFFWIAGLSLVNSLIILFSGEWSFIVGLGATQIDGTWSDCETTGDHVDRPRRFESLSRCTDLQFGLPQRLPSQSTRCRIECGYRSVRLNPGQRRLRNWGLVFRQGNRSEFD